MGRTSIAHIRKREILEHFYKVLSEDGLEGSSIAKVAKHMGVQPSLLMHYFSTKEEMIVGLVDYMVEIYWETFLSRLESIKDTGQHLDMLLDMLLDIEWSKLVDNTVFYACYYLSFRNERVKESFKRNYITLKELLIIDIQKAMNEGIIKTVDPEKVAILIISLVEGIDFYKNICSDDSLLVEFGTYLKEIVWQSLGMKAKGAT